MQKILVLCDDIWHPAEVIEKGMLPLAGDAYEFDVVKAAKDILTPEMLEEYPLIICCKSNNVTSGNSAPWFENTVTEVMGAEFRKYVERGGAFLSVHSGNVFMGDGDGIKEYTEFVGNRFLSHPLRCGVTLRKEKEHPIMQGVEARFDIRDEHYQMEILADDADVFLTSVSETGGIQIAGYTRKIGDGRLCVLTPGHTLSVWKNEQFQRIFLNAVNWCLHGEEDAE
ncbi:ThuA domain-containing protein [Bariatricus sp. SGI.154]|uniref:ThuA domain-containing protein n=1 Tax=Bariatricus sp. SGI.154 TaxID=3420549 RepID=UPI003D013C45